MKLVNAENKILGRMAANVAKMALEGEEVAVYNAEKAIISGDSKQVISRFVTIRNLGTQQKGPFPSRLADRIVRRTIRGMLPYKKPRGRAAFDNVQVFIDKPEGLKGEETEMKGAEASKLKNHNHVFIKDISKYLGARME